MVDVESRKIEVRAALTEARDVFRDHKRSHNGYEWTCSECVTLKRDYEEARNRLQWYEERGWHPRFI